MQLGKEDEPKWASERIMREERRMRNRERWCGESKRRVERERKEKGWKRDEASGLVHPTTSTTILCMVRLSDSHPPTVPTLLSGYLDVTLCLRSLLVPLLAGLCVSLVAHHPSTPSLLSVVRWRGSTDHIQDSAMIE